LQDFYAAFGTKVAAAPAPASKPVAPATDELADTAPPPADEQEAPVASDTNSAPTLTAQPAPEPAEPTASEASEFDLESKRNDWRARFRAALDRNKN